MARLFTSGFELNSTTKKFPSGNTGGTIQTSTVRSGTYAFEVSSIISVISQSIVCQLSSTDTNGPYFARAYFRFAAFPGADTTIMRFIDSTSNNSPQEYIDITSTGTLKLKNSGTVIGSASSALSLNTWYMIVLKYDSTGG